MNPDTAISSCIKTRLYAVNTLTKVLKETLSDKTKVSELQFRNTWFNELNKNSDLFTDGWYMPPPHGIGVLFANENNIERVCPPSLRLDEFWPKNDEFLDRTNGFIFVYASPVNKKTRIIGDVGLTLYLGNNTKIINHIKICYAINKKIFEYVQIGMSFLEINNYTHKLLTSNSLVSDLVSPTDPSKTNTGHTIPGIVEGWKDEELNILETSPWTECINVISHKRRFVNSVETLKVQPGMAFTIEPRPVSAVDRSLPMVWFHMICTIDTRGEKKLLTDFDEIFKIAGMNYLRTP